MCSIACIFDAISTFSQCFRHPFLLLKAIEYTNSIITLLKNGPALGSHIAQICKANTTCNICRIHVSLMSSCWSPRPPTLNRMPSFAKLPQSAEHKLQGGGVALPRGPSIKNQKSQKPEKLTQLCVSKKGPPSQTLVRPVSLLRKIRGFNN